MIERFARFAQGTGLVGAPAWVIFQDHYAMALFCLVGVVTLSVLLRYIQ